jgi:hypothetical protein
VAQASDNFGELSELHDPVTANYAGQSPMVGFGAGAYLLALYDRGTPVTPTCGAFAGEPANPSDAGADGAASGEGGTVPSDSGAATGADSGAMGDAGGILGDDGGSSNGASSKGSSSSGCGCRVATRGEGLSLLAAALPLLMLGLRRRPR